MRGKSDNIKQSKSSPEKMGKRAKILWQSIDIGCSGFGLKFMKWIGIIYKAHL